MKSPIEIERYEKQQRDRDMKSVTYIFKTGERWKAWHRERERERERDEK